MRARAWTAVIALALASSAPAVRAADDAAPLAPAAPVDAGATDLELLEAALAELYAPETPDLDEIMRRLDALKVKRSRDARVEVGLAMANALAGERRGDLDLIARSVRRAELAAATNRSPLVQSALGLTALVGGRTARSERDRERYFAVAERALDVASRADETPEDRKRRWLDLYYRGLALAGLGKREAAIECLGQAGGVAPGARAAVPEEAIGRILAEDGALLEAVEALREARAFAPRSAALALALGEALLGLGDPSGALEALEPAVRTRAGARALARAEIALGKPRAGIEALAAECADQENATAEAFALRGELERLAGDDVSAEADFREAIRRSGFLALAHAGLAELALARGDSAHAFERARVAAALEPRSVRAQRRYVRALEAAARPGGPVDARLAEARKRLAVLISIETAARAAGRLPLGDVIARRAEARLAEGRFEEAVRAVDALVRLDPDDTAAAIVKLRALLSGAPGTPAELRALAARLVERFPDIHDARALAAAAARHGADEATARAEAERALALEPTNALAKGILGAGARAGGGSAPLPPELETAAADLRSSDPVRRARGAEALGAHPVGIDLLLTHIEREPEPFVVGAIARVLGERGERRAVPVLVKLLETLPPTQEIARARAIRALGKLGDASALPGILEASLQGTSLVERISVDAVTELMAGVDEAGVIRFQRSLLDSDDRRKRGLAPVFGRRLLAAEAAKRAEASVTAGSQDHLWLIRLGLVLALAGAIVWRWRAGVARAAVEREPRRTRAARSSRD